MGTGIARRTPEQRDFSLERFKKTVAKQGGTVLEPEWLGYKMPHHCRCCNGHDCYVVPRRADFGQAICKTCRPGGFAGSLPGVLYLIVCPELRAYKIGIAGAHTRRLTDWQQAGWRVVATMEFEIGSDAAAVEAAVLAWLLSERRIPARLGPDDMKGLGGWTETFSTEEISATRIWKRVCAEVKRMGTYRRVA